MNDFILDKNYPEVDSPSMTYEGNDLCDVMENDLSCGLPPEYDSIECPNDSKIYLVR